MHAVAGDERLAYDPWTKQHERVQFATPSQPARLPRPAVKNLAEGRLFLWERRSLHFKPVECSISADVHGVWCLLGSDNLRVPLASICMVRIVSVAKLTFRIVRFGE